MAKINEPKPDHLKPDTVGLPFSHCRPRHVTMSGYAKIYVLQNKRS